MIRFFRFILPAILLAGLALGLWGPLWMFLGLLVSALGLIVYGLRTTKPEEAPKPEVAWASEAELSHLWLDDSGADDAEGKDGRAVGRVVVGMDGNRKVALGRCESLLVVGRSRASKTSGLSIPTVLEWPGPAVVASPKIHLMDETIGWRSHRGEVHVYDPAGVSRYRRSGWSPLQACQTWPEAVRMAQHLTAAASASFAGRSQGEDPASAEGAALSNSACARSLAPFLYAASAGGRTIVEAAEWIEREERDEVLEVLTGLDKNAVHAHKTTFFRDDATRSGFFHLMYQVLSVYGDPSVEPTTASHELVADELLDGGQHTWYLAAPQHEQPRFQPLLATIVQQLLAAVSERFSSRREPLDPPLLLLVDQGIGAASAHDLATLASTAAGKGIQVVSVFDDLGRFEGVPGESAVKLQAVGVTSAKDLMDITSSGVTKGVQVLSVFKDMSRFEPAGESAVRLANNHRAVFLVAPGHRADAAGSTAPAMTPERAAELSDGQGALFFGKAKPARLRLRRWYEEPELRQRVEIPQDAVPPAKDPEAMADRGWATLPRTPRPATETQSG